MDESEEAVDRLRRQRATLADFGLHANRCEDLDELLQMACELVSETLGIDLVKVLQHFPERNEMLVRAGVNWGPGVVGSLTLGDHVGSPGGYALKVRKPVISREISTETRFEIPKVLIDHGVRSAVNVLIEGQQDAFGVLEVDSRDYCEFDEDTIAFLQNYANLLAAAIERIRLTHALRQNAHEQSLLARELGHRVKNLLGLVQALASQTAAGERSGEEFRDAFMGRLRALAAAETLVFEDRGDFADLLRIAEEVLEPYRMEDPARITIDGSSAKLPARNGRMFGLALHELATNASKHGALSEPDGEVHLSWRLQERDGSRRIQLTWKERNGPEVRKPEKRGFGTRLLEDLVSHELNGSAELNYEPTGLSYTLSFPVADE